MNRPATRPVETEISCMVAVAQDDREMALEWDHDGMFSAADKRRIVAALSGRSPDTVDETARECVLELGERCGFDVGPGGRTRLNKREKEHILSTLREAAR